MFPSPHKTPGMKEVAAATQSQLLLNAVVRMWLIFWRKMKLWEKYEEVKHIMQTESNPAAADDAAVWVHVRGKAL